MARQADYVQIVRDAARHIWLALAQLHAAQTEWTALDYAHTLDPAAAGHPDVTLEDVEAVVWDTTSAALALINSGHGTNLARLL